MSVRRVGRRAFLVGLNLSLGGLALGWFPDASVAAAPPEDIFDPNPFIHIARSGAVTIVCARSEMGQGVRSSLPVLMADELGADVARVTVVQADGDKKYGDQNTDGSSSVRGHFDELRRISAVARAVLIAAAAKKLHAPAAALVAKDGKVTHAASKRSVAFGELVPLAVKLPVPDEKHVALRPRSELEHLGKALPLLDAPAYVTGQAVYAADVRVPGTLVAVIARPPVVGASVARFDPAPAQAIPGVKHVIRMPDAHAPYKFQPWGGVAVVAADTYSAMRGRAALHVEWSPSDNGSYDSATYRQTLEQSVRAPGTAVKHKGDADAALAKASARVEALYYVPHLPHVPMEPPCATARLEGGKLEIWACTQSPGEAKSEAARVTGVDERDVTVHVTFLGGAFGRKAMADFVAEAAFLAKHLGVPVRVQWTREDDVRHDYYNTVSAQLLSAGLDDKKKVVAWRRRTAFPPIRSIFDESADEPSAGDLVQGVTDLALDVPNVRAETCEAPAHVRIGWLRSVYNIFHAFATNCFLDEIAHARGMDPLESYLDVVGPARNLSLAELGVDKLGNYGQSLEAHPVDAGRLRHVLERVADAAKWKDRKRDGRAFGLAAHRSFLAYVACAVALAKEKDGTVRVDEAWVVLDAGTVVNLDRARSQMEGAVVFGTTLALFGGPTFKHGAVVESNFHDLRITRIAQAPRAIHVDVVQSELPPCGIGEPGVPPVAPAIANAYFALSGKRVRALPLAKAFGLAL